MAQQFSTAVRNANLESWEATIGLSAKISLYTGAPPASCAAAATGTLLLTFALASDYSPAAAAGVKSLGATPIAGAAVAAGTVGYYRITDSAGTTCHEQGTVTVTGGGGDATIDNVVIANLQAVNITSWTKTAPGA